MTLTCNLNLIKVLPSQNSSSQDYAGEFQKAEKETIYDKNI